jgi:hypothetical protein
MPDLRGVSFLAVATKTTIASITKAMTNGVTCPHCNRAVDASGAIPSVAQAAGPETFRHFEVLCGDPQCGARIVCLLPDTP